MLATRVIGGKLVANTISCRGWQLAVAHIIAARALLDHATLAASNVHRCAKRENDALQAQMRRDADESGVEAPERRDIGGLEKKYAKLHRYASGLEDRALADILTELDTCIVREDRPLQIIKQLAKLSTSPGYVSESTRAAQQAELRILDDTVDF